VRAMRAAGRPGRIVNVIARPALEPVGGMVAYAASKAAFNKLAGILHVEHARDGIRAFNLNPGFIVTEAQKALEGEDKFSGTFAGAGPDVPAAVIAWLASSEDATELCGGRGVDAQRVCEERQLIEGFERARGK